MVRNAPAVQVVQGSGGSTAPVVSPNTSSGGSSVTVVENASSAPSNSVGNGSGHPLSFQYFPLYVLDYNDGVILFPGQYQAATQSQTVSLYAQVTGTSASSYSWNTTGDNVTDVTGASTYHLQFEWFESRDTGGVKTEPITLTVTNSSSQQESQTFYFVFPTRR